MSLNTKSLFKGNVVAVTYQEAVEELREAYDQEMGLDTGNSHVAVSPYESPVGDTLYERWARIYQDKDIKKWWNIDLDKWIELPRWKIEIQIRIAEERARHESAAAARLLENAGNVGDNKK